ncbi:tRNA (guanosine(37)-N1)-methyltransferase TrmD [Candidatus Nitrosacidococcus sp. I8]|uniref:tRNA (guanosine(37)-N1)-methyltransferase TrmD n=1 Tax=Candidatus Nitrosacidococcus sp. I8 TaxID=2942908 RepID=UPI002225EA81|nr:tRNA (guanosine(37)-N1)-methyltransferase TrmD [Candidatus Nitrosacidococcus sp. I8]CAH9017758.1 tRNA (guanine-N(1)-)-methyltransferase [Candidatus Nitrosacidococcus sp. I8]
MNFGVITLFPGMFCALTQYGVVGRAIKRGISTLDFWNPRDFSPNLHNTVDDRPYGGGCGMVMSVQPLHDAICAARLKLGDLCRVIYLSPQGKKLDQSGLNTLSKYNKLILIAGRYEGIDERLIEMEVDEEWSIGDYVLSGGELAAMVLIDGLTRLLPGVLGSEESAHQDSFINGLLDYPHYTRPESIGDSQVPPVLLSGNHQAIYRWRLKQSLGRTWVKRPDLFNTYRLTQEQEDLLREFIQEYQENREYKNG